MFCSKAGIKGVKTKHYLLESIMQLHVATLFLSFSLIYYFLLELLQILLTLLPYLLVISYAGIHLDCISTAMFDIFLPNPEQPCTYS